MRVGFCIIALLCSYAVSESVRNYWRVPPSELAHTKHTHVQVRGYLLCAGDDCKRDEKDGDNHFDLCDMPNFYKAFDAHHCFVGELIPGFHEEFRSWKYVKGECLILFGIHRYDGEHRWEELHPIEEIKRCH